MRGTRLWMVLALVGLLASAMLAAGCGDDEDEGSSTEITSVNDLGGKTVGTQDGTTGETFAQDETDAANVRGFPEGPDAINALRQGQVDAVIIDYPVAEDAVNKQGGVEIVQQIVTSELYGIAFGPDSDPLREAANGALAAMKEDGTIADLYAKYKDEFKVDEPPAEVLDDTSQPPLEGSPGSIETLEEGGLLVGTDTPFPPFEIGQPPDITGYDIEVVNEIAKRLGLDVTYQDASFDTIFRDVAQGKYDAAVAASTITEEREQTVDFTDPYFKADQSLLVATDGS